MPSMRKEGKSQSSSTVSTRKSPLREDPPQCPPSSPLFNLTWLFLHRIPAEARFLPITQDMLDQQTVYDLHPILASLIKKLYRLSVKRSCMQIYTVHQDINFHDINSDWIACMLDKLGPFDSSAFVKGLEKVASEVFSQRTIYEVIKRLRSPDNDGKLHLIVRAPILEQDAICSESESERFAAQHLTVDIVREIFKNFSTPLVIPILDSHHDDRAHMKPFPWYLGQICSSWRTTFFSMHSEFWSTITIDAHHRHPHFAWEKAISVAKVFLERTEGRPFSFSVNAKYPCPSILDLFIAESTRWKGISLCLDDDDENIPLLRSIKNRLPQLCSLAINIEHGMPRDLPLLFEDVPALTHLSLIHLANWHMDWSLLTELELSREFNVGRLLRVLAQTTNLERLGVNRLIVNPKELNKKSFEPVTLSRLRTLEISGFTILQFLTTPALKRLYIYKSGDFERGDEPCASFFTRSLCQLQRFGAIRFWLDDFANIFPYMPDLKVLTVCDPVIKLPELMEAMTCRPGEQPLMPQLRVLRLSGGFWRKMDKFEKMLDSRGPDRFLHSVQELKAIVTQSDESSWQYLNKDKFKHPNVQLRTAKESEFSYDISTQFQWLCNDLDY